MKRSRLTVHNPRAVAPNIDWPNEPVGFAVALNDGMSNPAYVGGARASIISNAVGGVSPPFRTQASWLIGDTTDTNPDGDIYVDFPPFTPMRRLFYGNVRKPSNPYQWQTNGGTKGGPWFGVFGEAQQGQSMFLRIDDAPPYLLTLVQQGPGAVNQQWPFDQSLTPSAPLVLGSDNKIEILLIGNTAGQADGSVKVWLNGALIITATGIDFKGDGSACLFYAVREQVYFGGVSQTKTINDFIQSDHTYASQAA